MHIESDEQLQEKASVFATLKIIALGKKGCGNGQGHYPPHLLDRHPHRGELQRPQPPGLHRGQRSDPAVHRSKHRECGAGVVRVVGFGGLRMTSHAQPALDG